MKKAITSHWSDLLTAMTTSYLYIIIIGDDFQVLQSPRAAFNSSHLGTFATSARNFNFESGKNRREK